MRIEWQTDDNDTDAWQAFHAAHCGAMQQHHAFGRAMNELGTETRRAQVFDGERLVGIAQFIVRHFAGLLSFALCSRGPIYAADLSTETRGRLWREITRTLPARRPRIALLAPEVYDTADPMLHGRTPVVTGESTVLLDLTLDLDAQRAAMHPKWRNRLVAAERAGLKVQRVGTKPAQYGWLLEREGLQRQERSYRALPSAFVPAWQRACTGPDPALLTVRADRGRDAIAAMMFLIHGRAATYHLGWSDAAGREHNAHNLLLWQAMQWLRDMGVHRLELGAVNTQRGANLARFKIGSGGMVTRFAGTFW